MPYKTMTAKDAMAAIEANGRRASTEVLDARRALDDLPVDMALCIPRNDVGVQVVHQRWYARTKHQSLSGKRFRCFVSADKQSVIIVRVK